MVCAVCYYVKYVDTDIDRDVYTQKWSRHEEEENLWVVPSDSTKHIRQYFLPD